MVYEEDQITQIIVNQLVSIYSHCQEIGKDSFIKALYKGKNTLLLSKTGGKVIKERDMQLLTGFESPFYALKGPEMEYRPAVLQGLCAKIKISGNHACERCVKGKEVEDKMNEDEENLSEEALIEE